MTPAQQLAAAEHQAMSLSPYDDPDPEEAEAAREAELERRLLAREEREESDL